MNLADILKRKVEERKNSVDKKCENVKLPEIERPLLILILLLNRVTDEKLVIYEPYMNVLWRNNYTHLLGNWLGLKRNEKEAYAINNTSLPSIPAGLYCPTIVQVALSYNLRNSIVLKALKESFKYDIEERKEND